MGTVDFLDVSVIAVCGMDDSGGDETVARQITLVCADLVHHPGSTRRLEDGDKPSYTRPHFINL